MRIAKRHFTPGFTIIELLIVIVIIGILSTLVFVGYNGVKRQATVSALVSDLKQANTQLATAQLDNNDVFPESIDDLNGGDGLKFQDGATVFYSDRNDQDQPDYCLTAVVDDIVYHVSRYEAPREGYCTEHEPLTIAAAPVLSTTSDSTSEITVSWTAVEDAASYTLEWDSDSGFASPTTIEDIVDTSYALSGLTQNTTYYFRAYSVNDAGTSDASEVVSETTQLEAPSGGATLSCTVNSPSQITVSWTSVSGADTYTTDRSAASTFTSPTTTTDITDTSQVVTGLSAGSRYYFRVFAVNESGTGPSSNVVNCITTISAPDSPSVAASIPGSARAWNSGTWAKTYQGLPTSGTWYYAQASVSSSTCAAGTTREQRARIQYNSPTTWGAWTGYTTSTTFYAIGPSSGYGIRFQIQTRCETSHYTSAGSSYGYGCRWASGSTSCSGF